MLCITVVGMYVRFPPCDDESLDPGTGRLGTRTHDLVPRNVSRRNTVACENPAVLTFMSNPFLSISEASPPSKTQYPDLKYSADIGGCGQKGRKLFPAAGLSPPRGACQVRKACGPRGTNIISAPFFALFIPLVAKLGRDVGRSFGRK